MAPSAVIVQSYLKLCAITLVLYHRSFSVCLEVIVLDGEQQFELEWPVRYSTCHHPLRFCHELYAVKDGSRRSHCAATCTYSVQGVNLYAIISLSWFLSEVSTLYFARTGRRWLHRMWPRTRGIHQSQYEWTCIPSVPRDLAQELHSGPVSAKAAGFFTSPCGAVPQEPTSPVPLETSHARALISGELLPFDGSASGYSSQMSRLYIDPMALLKQIYASMCSLRTQLASTQGIEQHVRGVPSSLFIHFAVQEWNLVEFRFPSSLNRSSRIASSANSFSSTVTTQYISDIKVVYDSEPSGAVQEINGQGNNINKGQGGKYVYLVPVYTTRAADACNSFRLVVQDSEDSAHIDLARGVGRAYRYLLPLSDMKNEDKITSLVLLRSSSAVSSPPSGYSGITGDVNKDRGGDFLYLVWKTETVSFSQVYNLGIVIVFGSMPSQEPRGALTEIHGGGNDINEGFGGSYVWLVNNYTNSPDKACTAFNVVIQDRANDALRDLCIRANAKYGYLLNMQSNGIYSKVTTARLLRSSSAVSAGPPSGYDGMSIDLNTDRDKDYLYVVWKVEQAQCDDYLVSGLSVTYGSLPSYQPRTSVTEIHDSGDGTRDDINKGLGGSYVWISATYTRDVAAACNGFVVAIQNTEDSQQSNLAKGAGGSYRYLLPLRDATNDRKITNIRLLRSSSALTTPPDGYTGMTSDLNEGRGGDFLYVIWTEIIVPTRRLYVSGMTVKYGSMLSQEPSMAVNTLGANGDNINQGFGGSFVWLENTTTQNLADACTSFEIAIQSTVDPNLQDLVKGTDGDRRYLVLLGDVANPNKIIGTRLLRSDHAIDTPPDGYQGISTDINRGRKKDFLYIIWQTDSVGSAVQWVSGIDVVYGSQPSQEVRNAVHEIHGAGDNINMGYGGSYVWVTPQYSNYSGDACTSFNVVIRDSEMPGHQDLAKGAGRPHRYLIPVREPSARSKIVDLALLRSSSAFSNPPPPYSGMTSDINDGRGGDFLYLIWRTVPMPSSSSDDSFVILKDVDIPGYDIAHYPQAANNPSKLKDIALQKTGSLITAFNTDGWMKTCDPRRMDLWTRSPGRNLYVRVQFTGWNFSQGVDAPGNDMYNYPLGTNAPVVMDEIIDGPSDDNHDKVAGFNTSGWVKSQVTSQKQWTDLPINGLYTRLEFSDYAFFPQVDSPGNDIVQVQDLANNIPALIRMSNSYSNAAGFNTDGRIKSLIKYPPSSSSQFTQPTQGLYARIAWRGWTFLPGIDSPGNDKGHLTGKQVRELIDAANNDSDIVAFNTDGWMKASLADSPSENTSSSFPLYGLYVRISGLDNVKAFESLAADGAMLASTQAAERADDWTKLSIALFLMKSTALIWGRWFITDATVRMQYASAVAIGAADVRARWESGALSLENAVEEAVSMRNSWLRDSRARSSPLGGWIAEAIKPQGLSVAETLDRYASRKYNKKFADLTAEEGRRVVGAAIDASGRANRRITGIMKNLSRVGKAVMVVGVAMSMYQVVTAEDWKKEAIVQTGTWSASIIGGAIGTGVGALVSPIGAILGGLTGGLLGSWIGDLALSRWFYGGSSDVSGSALLHADMLSIARSMVDAHFATTGSQFLVHQIHATHLAVDIADKAAVTRMCATMIAASGSRTDSEDAEVIATVVWIRANNQTLPANAANPADFMTLLVWASRNLPSN
ncbi:hypothetical protein NM688_g1217 [Phlebia brevispora]|uniref:Uncharacterized protein n=1 Tax=Phlebia brevispora TaxID=194682 RepID=A0ACC1TBZ7_9APHY|nr:hypothetical protein NM688_g1217 [Phlebia brevispora]